MRARDWPRTVGALALAGASVLVLHAAHATWAATLLAGAAAALFVAWRTVPGACAGFAAFAGAAALAWPGGGPDSLGALAALLPWALALEIFGLLTILAVALARDERRISRRLLSSFLSSTGIGVLGLALCAAPGARAAGGALVVGALAYRLGAAPAYAWLPMLLRHPSRRIQSLGAAGVLAAGLVLARALPQVPDPRAAGAVLGALSAVTIPWAGWHAWRQRREDPPCARTYLVVVAVSLVLLVVALSR